MDKVKRNANLSEHPYIKAINMVYGFIMEGLPEDWAFRLKIEK